MCACARARVYVHRLKQEVAGREAEEEAHASTSAALTKSEEDARVAKVGLERQGSYISLTPPVAPVSML